jgi:hypothetical protein
MCDLPFFHPLVNCCMFPQWRTLSAAEAVVAVVAAAEEA